MAYIPVHTLLGEHRQQVIVHYLYLRMGFQKLTKYILLNAPHFCLYSYGQGVTKNWTKGGTYSEKHWSVTNKAGASQQ